MRKSWAAGALSMAAATLALGFWPSHSVAVYVASAVFGGNYVALTSVFIMWTSLVAPGREAARTAALFSNPTLAFVLAAALASCSAVPAMLNTRADAVRETAAGGQGR